MAADSARVEFWPQAAARHSAFTQGQGGIFYVSAMLILALDLSRCEPVAFGYALAMSAF